MIRSDSSLQIDTLKVGDSFDILNGKEICDKYIPRSDPHRARGNGGKKNGTISKPKVRNFTNASEAMYFMHN